MKLSRKRNQCVQSNLESKSAPTPPNLQPPTPSPSLSNPHILPPYSALHDACVRLRVYMCAFASGVFRSVFFFCVFILFTICFSTSSRCQREMFSFPLHSDGRARANTLTLPHTHTIVPMKVWRIGLVFVRHSAPVLEEAVRVRACMRARLYVFVFARECCGKINGARIEFA